MNHESNEYKFLIIEDDPATRELLTLLLRKHFKSNIKEAENGLVGIEVLKEFTPDIIFLDLSMPVLDGKSTLKLIQNNTFLKNIPVIILTAHGDKNTVEDLLEFKIAEYILKPIDINITILRIKNVLSKIQPAEGIQHSIDKLNFNTNEILIVTKDNRFPIFLACALGKEFIIYSATSGSAGFDIFSKHNPGIIILSEEMSILDKKIISKKLKEVSDTDIEVFLMIDENHPLTSSVFNYDGVIKKSFDKDLFLEELSKLVPHEPTPLQKFIRAIENSLPNIEQGFKSVFLELSDQEINFVDKAENESSDNNFYITYLFVKDYAQLSYSISAGERNIVSIANLINAKSGRKSESANNVFKQLADIFAEIIKKNLHFNNINLIKESRSEITMELQQPTADWECNLHFETNKKELFNHRLSILSTSTKHEAN
jgi:DNA-binding response OmpR family regulator